MSWFRILWVAGLLTLAPAGAVSQSVREQTAAVGAQISWPETGDRKPTRYRVGNMSLTPGWRPESGGVGLFVPELIVRMPGLTPVRAEGMPQSSIFMPVVAVGRWNASRLYVLLQTYSGGAHCCTRVQIVVPEARRLRLISLGEWDGGHMFERPPTDLNGDGAIDFVFVDNAFLYAFASYADSHAPPKILNVVNGMIVDVSARRGFRPLFERALAQQRAACLNRRDSVHNGACAAYAASAARLGRFEQAWPEVLRAYDRNGNWDLPTGCRVAAAQRACPENQVVRFANYPDALRYFLAARGYIDR